MFSVDDVLTSRKTTYSHDDLDRLTATSTAPSGGGTPTRYEGYCYDKPGNLTKYLSTTATTCTSGTPTAMREPRPPVAPSGDLPPAACTRE